LGYVENLDAEYASADVVVAPVVAGGGWQTKISEAMEHGKPVVATRFACRGFRSFARAQPGLWVTDGITQMAGPCIGLLQDRDSARAGGARLRTAALEAFPHQRFRDKVLQTVQTVLG
jgi:glycosyltransferase involved in cell wall biosynthesis